MRFIIVQINPMLMRGESGEEASQLETYTENFVSWYRYISQDQGEVLQITNALKEIWPHFEHFKFTETGEAHRVLKLSFARQDGERDFIDYRFDELSDGERTLVVLYALLHHAHRSDYTLCIDEPENFLALPEIQPWLTTLYDFCSADELQALLISHHPEFIDYLASSLGYWFEYRRNAPIRVKRISDDNGSGLPMSELVSRGWVREVGA
jgi:predicted ATPase